MLLIALAVLFGGTSLPSERRDADDHARVVVVADVVAPVAVSFELGSDIGQRASGVVGVVRRSEWAHEGYVDPCAGGRATKASREELRRRSPGPSRSPRAPPHRT